MKRRSPTSTAVDDELHGYLDNTLSAPHETLIMRLQSALHNWTTCQSRAPGSKLIDLINTNSLQQHVNKPTKQKYILDLVMTTTDLKIIGFEITDKIGDHHIRAGSP
ncbi:hypothetical protein FHG87_005413 [Trinorchestia longiramus]|nr:hypothetical protein FHG87_005413 [Trinorchestia longiramus]